MSDLFNAVLRYMTFGQKIPTEWIDEIDDLLARYEREQPQDIRSGEYKGIDVGDYFTINGVKHVVVKKDIHRDYSGIVLRRENEADAEG
jgi:hypothetical protein